MTAAPDPGGRKPSRGPGRRPGPTETREAILASARALFTEKGYNGASLRAIARDAGVDPALVHHFFGSKEGVFVAAVKFPIEPAELLPRIMAAPREKLGETVVRTFTEIWSDDGNRERVLNLLSSAMTNESAAMVFREFISEALFARAAEIHDIPLVRLDAAAGHMVGVMIFRYVLKIEPIASLSEDELVELIAPALQQYLG
ncbi:TetR family transcriptional regulator [Spirillospora sp. CA-294931]|uniref:TetR/AcrR family transcriptional regulator n=1 Tax=Spirillospora sp. CA-294931 TaxID=3240042 RepID=UPI003D8FC762